MKAIVRILLASAAGLLSLGSSALAADILDAPIYGDVPEIVPVEIGSGWYLRGDVAYGFETELTRERREYRPDFDLTGFDPGSQYDAADFDYFDGGKDDWTIDADVGFGVGVGYQFTDFLRGDLTAHYWKQDLSTGTSDIDSCVSAAEGSGYDPALLDCSERSSGDVKTWELMANAYVDLGTFAGLTPYVGAGAGAANLRYGKVKNVATCSYDGSVCDPDYYEYEGSHEESEEWRFAYALMAGASYDLTKSLKLDVGYRYVNIDGGDMHGYDDRSKSFGASGIEAIDDGFDRHTIQAGVRYSLF